MNENVTYQNVERMEICLATILSINSLTKDANLTHWQRNRIDFTITFLARKGLEFSSVSVNLDDTPKLNISDIPF